MTVLRAGSASHVGRVRTINEDLAFLGSTLFAVADGMGGHVGGEVAARTAIDSLRAGFEHSPSAEGLVDAVREANHAVWEKGRSEPSLRGMGTTLTAAALVDTGDGERLVLANVGDSRAYRLHRHELGQVTVDHSVAEELVARGELSEREAAVHPHRHILTRALGVDNDVEVDTWELVPEQGDRFLLCSDGLSNEASLDEISAVLSQTRDPQEAADRLVRLANDNGGNDNVTALVLDVLVGAPGVDGKGAAEVAAPATVIARADEVEEAQAPQPTTTEAPPARRSAPRRVTFRVILFVLLLGALGYGAWAAVRWYVNNSYFVGLHHGEVVVFQGREGGFLGMHAKVVEHTGITMSEVQSSLEGTSQIAPKLRAGVEEPTRADAIRYVCNLPVLAPGAPPPIWSPVHRWAKCNTNLTPASTPTTQSTSPITPGSPTSAPTSAPSAIAVVPDSGLQGSESTWHMALAREGA